MSLELPQNKAVALFGLWWHHRTMILGTTGHRKLQHPRDQLADAAVHFLTKLQPSSVITGMALGWDTLVAATCVHLGIPFIAAVPFEGQEKRWTPQQQQVYRNLLELAAQVEIVSPGRYETWKLFKRNEWIVEQSDVLVGYVDPEKLASGISGSTHCFEYALKKLGPNKVRNAWPKPSNA
jgi:uncharacterized phage-like protein YoqJ